MSDTQEVIRLRDSVRREEREVRALREQAYASHAAQVQELKDDAALIISIKSEVQRLRAALAELLGKAEAYRTMSLQNVIPTVTAHQFVVAIGRAKEALKGGGDE